ncbi:hypothetical protein AJ88_17545 [Mesorhizobium amorphae CCBAU 01583]|nr:hypothetical protein AJ88_17545 [Mesorhizobium amorphae CCBAU 01583]
MATALQHLQQLPRRLRNPFNRIALFSQVVQHGEHAGRHVEADRIAGAAGSARIVRDQDGELAFGARRTLEANERFDAVRNLRDAVGLRPVGEGAEGQSGIGLAFALEGDGANEDAAVEFGQHDMHGKVGGRQAALVFLPDVAPGGATMTWNTGTPARSNRVSTPGSAPEAKAVAVMMADGLRAASAFSTNASDVGSFRLETKMGAGAMPRALSASKSASIGATSAASSIER